MTSRSKVLAFIAAHTPPAAVAAAADLLAATAPVGPVSHAETVDWALRTAGVPARISAFLADREDAACASPAQWARLGVVTHSAWCRGLDSRLRQQVAIDLVGPCAYNAYMDWAIGGMLKAA